MSSAVWLDVPLVCDWVELHSQRLILTVPRPDEHNITINKMQITFMKKKNLKTMAGRTDAFAAGRDDSGIIHLACITTRSPPPEAWSFHDNFDCFEFPEVTSWMSARGDCKTA